MYGKKYMGIIRSAFLVDEKGKIAGGLAQDQPQGHAGQPAQGLGRDRLPAPVDVLPHRPPFLFVDELVEVVPGRVGHRPLAPHRRRGVLRRALPRPADAARVLMVEALAQVGAIAVLARAALRRQAAAVRRHRRRALPPPGRAGRHARPRVEMGRLSARAGQGPRRRVGRRRDGLRGRPAVRHRRRVISRARPSPGVDTSGQ